MEYKEKEINLYGNRRLINAVKKAGLKTYNPTGEWNGYGYERFPLHVIIRSVGEMRKFNKIKKELEQNPVKAKTEEEKIISWCRRLSKLTGIDETEARQIADEKIDYKMQKIEEKEDTPPRNTTEKNYTKVGMRKKGAKL